MSWVTDLSFLADITHHLKSLNLLLRRTKLSGSFMIMFQHKHKLSENQITYKNCVHFPSLNMATESYEAMLHSYYHV